MSESLEHEIRTLRAHFWSDRDPEGRAFAPLADAYRRKGDLAEAESLVQDGLGRLPDFATGRLISALIRRDQGRLDDAMSELDRLLDLDPLNVLGIVERAGVAAQLGDRESAMRDAARALEVEPGNVPAEAVLRELEGGPEVTEEAESPAEEFALGKGPEVSPSPEEEPVGELEGLDLDDPMEDAEEAPPVYTRTLGELYARQGFPDRAIEVYEQLAADSPGDPDLAARLDELREQVGGREVAGREGGREHGQSEERAPQWTEADPSVGDMETVFAWSGGEPDEVAAATGRPIGRYFESLMAWVPGAVPISSLAPEEAAPVPIASLAPDVPLADVEAEGPEPGVGSGPG